MGRGGAAGTEGKTVEELNEKIKDLEETLIEHWEYNANAGDGKTPIAKTPAKPTEEEWKEHQVTHTPPKPWCKYCMMGRGTRRAHRVNVPDTEPKDDGPNKVSIDYMYLNDEDANRDQVHMAMVDHNHGRVFAYTVPRKGVTGEAEWISSRIIRDIDNMGYKNVCVQVKSDQEPAIVAVQEYIRFNRDSPTIPINSPVGESECNGRVENAIRRIKEKTRTLIAQIEDGMKDKIPKGSNIIPWLVRWSGELLSKYALVYDGKTPYERLRGERSKVPLATFGEAVLYLPLKTAKPLKEQAQPKMKMGIWLGVIERTEETIIGTDMGIVKCRTINRLPEDQRWNKSMILSMKGTPWAPVPKVKGDHIPVEIKKDGSSTNPEEENGTEELEIAFEKDIDLPSKPQTSGYKGAGMKEFHIKKPMVQKYGYTDGCAACQKLRDMSQGGRPMTGRLGVNHSIECKARIMQKMSEDPNDRHLVENYYKRAKTEGSGKIKQTDVPQQSDQEDAEHSDKSGKQLGLERAMLNMTMNVMDIAEVYSPDRVTEMARSMGFTAGWALDLTTSDENGRAWDFDCLAMRNKAVRKLLQDKPKLLVGSPMCTEFSSWMSINHPKMPKEVVQQRLERARNHLKCCTKLYAIQIRQGRYFLHEHPAGAASWQEECIQNILGNHGVMHVKADQCQYGLMSKDGLGEGLVRKTTGFMTNAQCVAVELTRKCPNRNGKMAHRHVTLEGGRTRPAQVYPDELCRAICRGMINQIDRDRRGQFMLANLQGTRKEANDIREQLDREFKTVEDDQSDELESAWDDVLGAELELDKVKKARAEELEYIRKMKLYTKVHASECWKKTGKAPIKVRWIDINKGDTKGPNYRSRLVAKEINTCKKNDLFAATPPLEAFKLVISMATTNNRGEIVMINDVSRAFSHAKVQRDVYVDLPEEDVLPGDEGKCAKLEFSLYGTRDAAINWHNEYSQQLSNNGFIQGESSPCTFYHPCRKIRTIVHGDDYVSVGQESDLQWLEQRLKDKYEIKTKWLGYKPEHQQEVRVLNRIISWSEQGIEYEADPRHVEVMLAELGLKECTHVTTPGISTEGRTGMDCEKPLQPRDESRYRALVARANYISPDRPDIAFAAKELAKAMASPTQGDWCRLKRPGRYLAGKLRLKSSFQWQGSQREVMAYSDADWAGDKQSRKSTSGGCILIGGHLIKGWSKSQSLIALSSAESEVYAALKTSSETLGIISMSKDFGYVLTGKVWGDASAALSIIHRKGLGRTRHIDTSYLWIQQIAAQRRLAYAKVLGRDNPADLYTKYLDAATAERHVNRFKCAHEEGRSKIAPELHLISISWDEHLQLQPENHQLHLEKVSSDMQSRIIKKQVQGRERINRYLLAQTTRRHHGQAKLHNQLQLGWDQQHDQYYRGENPIAMKKPNRMRVMHKSLHDSQSALREPYGYFVNNPSLAHPNEAATGSGRRPLNWTTTVSPLVESGNVQGSLSNGLPISNCLGAASEGGFRDIQGIVYIQTYRVNGCSADMYSYLYGCE